MSHSVAPSLVVSNVGMRLRLDHNRSSSLKELFLHLGDGGKVGETEHQDRDQIARQQDPGP